MRKIRLYTFIGAASVLASVSCVKESTESASPVEGIKFTVSTGAIPGTKTEVVPGTYIIAWQNTDKVGFMNGKENVNVESSPASIDGSGKATFTGIVDAEGEYYAYYPYQSDSYAPAADGVTVRIPNEQRPTATSFDPKTDILLSEKFAVSAEGSTKPALLRFARHGAFIKISFIDGTTGGKLNGEYANTVAIEADKDENKLVGRFKIHGENGLVFQNSGYKKVTATYEEGRTLELLGEGQGAWFGVRPQTFANGSKITLTIDTEGLSVKKELALPKEVVLGAGDLLPLNVTITDADVTLKNKITKIKKVWEILSTNTAWTTTLSADGKIGTAGTDMNIAVDDKYVYIPEFGSSKNMWAISVTDKDDVKLVNTSAIENVGFDGSIYLTCARVVAKEDGSPVLLASNLFQDGSSDNPTGRLYIWKNGIDNAPAVVNLQQWGANRRLGDRFTTFGNFEDCWLIFGTQTGNGFVTFKVPTTGTSASLVSRLAVDTYDFATYYPFPGELTRGMFSWTNAGTTKDDSQLYRNRIMSVSSSESAIKTEGAHNSTIDKLSTWMENSENNNGIGYNYTEFNGKQYAIWCMNSTDSRVFDLIVKEAAIGTDWKSMIDTAGTFIRETHSGDMATSWKGSADCAIWNTGKEVYIAINKLQVGIALYRMYTE